MVRTVPTAEEVVIKYRARVSVAGADWLKGVERATGVVEAARSDAAETQFAAKMSAAIANKSRVKGLAGVTDEDIKAAARAVGPGGYSTPAAAKAAKLGKKIGPYLDVIRAVLPTLPPKTADGLANLTARAGPIVQALQAKKRGGV
jgi:hypothetical protein